MLRAVSPPASRAVSRTFTPRPRCLLAEPSALTSLPRIFYLSFLVVFYLSHLHFSRAKAVVLQIKSVVGFCIDLPVFTKPLKK